MTAPTPSGLAQRERQRPTGGGTPRGIRLLKDRGIADSGAVSDKSEFPIVVDETKWQGIAGRTLALLSPRHVDEIRRLQPFADETTNSPNVMLGMLDALENRDKHRLPLVVATAATRSRLSLGAPIRRLELTTSMKGPVQVGPDPVELFRLRAWGPSELPVKALIQFGVAFGHREGPTALNLRDLADLIAGIIASFAIDIATGRPKG